MRQSDVDKIIEIFQSKDWSDKYEYHNEYWKKNIWFKIGHIEEFGFIKQIINDDLEKINENYVVSDWITFLIYEKGDFFGVHTDDDIRYNQTGMKILFTGGYILNDDFKGGDFLISDKKLEVNVGELFMFGRSEKHEVTTVESGIRYSLHFAIETKINKKSLL